MEPCFHTHPKKQAKNDLKNNDGFIYMEIRMGKSNDGFIYMEIWKVKAMMGSFTWNMKGKSNDGFIYMKYER